MKNWIALLALAALPALAQQDFSKVEIKTEKLNDTTYMLMGAGGNENFGKAGAVIVAHDNVRKRMSTEQFIEFLRPTSRFT